MIFMSFPCRGSDAICWGGVGDLSTLADFDASATTFMQRGPHSGLEQLSPLANLCTRILHIYIYIYVYEVCEFHM